MSIENCYECQQKALIEYDKLSNRFWSKVNKNGPYNESLISNCWEWTGTTDTGGYGQIGIAKRLIKVHRVSYTMLIGPIPEGMDMCHKCDNRICVNPAHLFPGTHSENMKDGYNKGRIIKPSRWGK